MTVEIRMVNGDVVYHKLLDKSESEFVDLLKKPDLVEALGPYGNYYLNTKNIITVYFYNEENEKHYQ